jgi:excinuclease ABC subunit B
MQAAINEVERRRKIQEQYNKKHGITPQSIQKAISESRLAGKKLEVEKKGPEIDISKMDKKEVRYYLEELKDRMDLASKNLEFERAAELRDQVIEINKALKRKRHAI